jgi:hypothetical protein
VLGQEVLVKRKMNNYHRFLNIEDCIPNVDFSQWDTDSVTEWAQFHKNLTLEELNNPNLLQLLDSLNMTSGWIEVFCTPANSKGVIHSDSPIGEEWSKLIFQYGAPGSKMRWWTSDKIHIVSTDLTEVSKEEISDIDQYIGGDRSGGHYHGKIQVAYDEDSKLEYEVEVGKCSLINIGPLHSSYNPTNEKRLVVTVALFDAMSGQRILWNEALNRLKDYVKEN